MTEQIPDLMTRLGVIHKAGINRLHLWSDPRVPERLSKELARKVRSQCKSKIAIISPDPEERTFIRYFKTILGGNAELYGHDAEELHDPKVGVLIAVSILGKDNADSVATLFKKLSEKGIRNVSVATFFAATTLPETPVLSLASSLDSF